MSICSDCRHINICPYPHSSPIPTLASGAQNPSNPDGTGRMDYAGSPVLHHTSYPVVDWSISAYVYMLGCLWGWGD
jgi:hypothetical protein